MVDFFSKSVRISEGYFQRVWGAYNKYIDEVRKLVANTLGAENKNATMKSILKVISLDIVLTLESCYCTKYRLQEELEKIEENKFGKIERMTISIGVAKHSIVDSKDTLIKKADKKLYEAKKKGRNRTC